MPAPAPAPVSPAEPRDAARPAASASHARGFWFATAAFTVQMAFGTVPTPLWPLYAQRDGFGSTTVTVAFAAMVVGAAGGFLLLGHLSDRLGRRRILVPALLSALVATLLLLVWPALPGLLIARLFTGIGIGLMASTATAYLADLYHQAHPDRHDSAFPQVVATAANLGGLALGPLASGILAQWAPAPLVTPYAAFGVALAVLTALVLASPETVDREAAAAAPARFALLPHGRRAFGAAAALACFSFAVMGLFSALGAVMVSGVLGIGSHLVAGLAPFALFAASAVAQLLLSRFGTVRMLIVGAVLFPAGLALTAVALYHPSLWLYLSAAGLAGAGAGLLFKGAVAQTVAAAEPASRAGVLAVLFAVAYAGMGAPTIAFSIVSQHAGLAPTMIGFAALLSVGAVASVAAPVKWRVQHHGRHASHRAARRHTP
jgi:predicted MFS family arabinose efflux permease